jgi:signal transduction histidine kinase
VRTDEGQRLTEEIRAELGRFEQTAERLLAERNIRAERAARMTTMVALGCGALAFAAAALAGLGLMRRRETRQMIERNARLEREVIQRTAALQEANDALEAFAATISHDLRAPVRAIGGYADALMEDAADRLEGPERDYVLRIGSAAERMDGLIGEILAYSRLAGQELRLTRVSLESVVQAVLDQQAEEAAAVAARIDVARPMPAAQGHEGALELAVGNLLSNALKFTKRGEAPEVRIWAEPRPGERVRLWVEDRGIGLPHDQQDRIFRPFERLHGREAFPGNGVGLSVVRRVAERLGGAAGVEVEPGRTRFWLELPVAPGPAPEAQSASHAGGV